MEYTSKEVYEYVSRKSNDPIVEWKKCHVSWQEFPIYKSDIEFYDKVSPTFEVSEEYAKEFLEKNSDIKDRFEYKDWKLKAKLPTPTLCPEERERRRFAFMNEQSLYKRKCDNSWKNLIGIFSPDKNYIVYDQDFWRAFNRKTYKIDNYQWDFKDNISELLLHTPIANRAVLNCENSDYANQVRETKNSYMCFNCIDIEDCFYIYKWVSHNQNCIDCDKIDHCSVCFSSTQLRNCMFLFFCENCSDCSNSYYLLNCVWCHDCYNCNNLVNKSYCINNKQYTKQEYQEIISKTKNERRKPNWEINYIWCTQKDCDSSFWDNLVWCKKTLFCYELTDCENVKYSWDVMGMKDTYDTRWINAQFCLESYLAWEDHHCWFLFESRSNTNSRYSIYCHNSQNIFWCVWLQNKKYCIYNKQYTKEEYNQIVPKIIAQMIRNEEWWEFFNPSIAFYWYNETMAMEKYPLTKQEAWDRWYKWSDYEAPLPHVEKIVQWKKLPKQGCGVIKEKKPDILEKILNYAIVCEVSNKPFRITKQEIEFYIEYNIPLPTKHPDIRHKERFIKRNPTTLKLISCDGCWEEILSVYKKWEWRKILCEKCFYKNI